MNDKQLAVLHQLYFNIFGRCTLMYHEGYNSIIVSEYDNPLAIFHIEQLGRGEKNVEY